MGDVMRNRTTKVLFPIFNGVEVRIIVTKDIVGTGRRLGVDLTKTVAAYVPADEDKPKVSWLVYAPDADPGTVAHEASHAVQAIFNHVGAKMDDDENYAYHLDYLVGRVHKFLKGRKR